MPFLIIHRQRFALPVGDTLLAGRHLVPPVPDAATAPSPDASAWETAAIAARLAELPEFLCVTVAPDGVTTVRRGARDPVGDVAPHIALIVDGAVAGREGRELRHGSRIDVVDTGERRVLCRLLFGDARSMTSTDRMRGITDEELAAFVGLPGEPTADTGGRLTALTDGRVYRVPQGGLVIGRDPVCDIVLGGNDVSRRHATVKPSLYGYVLTDSSSNGTFVNGRRVEGAQVLGMGDVVRIGREQFRFEADPALDLVT
jgi:hypothetical protein